MRSQYTPKSRVLVVEDDLVVRQTISRLLEREGYAVTTATDGFDALLHLQNETPDVIVSDLNMPQMSGFELLPVVRRRFPKILVVACFQWGSAQHLGTNASPRFRPGSASDCIRLWQQQNFSILGSVSIRKSRCQLNLEGMPHSIKNAA